MNFEKERIGIEQIEEMYMLAEDVLNQLQMRYSEYTAEGENIFDIIYEHYRDSEDCQAFYETLRVEREKNSDHMWLLQELFCNTEYDLTKVLELTAEELIKKHLTPIIEKAVKLFRRGISCGDTRYIADDNVTDEYLKTLFAVRVRDRMIACACQRGIKTFFFLTWSMNSCHDMDEWVGIYKNTSTLRAAYKEELEKLGNAEDEYMFYSCYKPEHLKIYEFTEGEKRYKELKPEEIWGDRI